MSSATPTTTATSRALVDARRPGRDEERVADRRAGQERGLCRGRFVRLTSSSTSSMVRMPLASLSLTSVRSALQRHEQLGPVEQASSSRSSTSRADRVTRSSSTPSV